MYKPLITDMSKKYGNNRWLAYSNKLKRIVYLFSDLEYEHWLQIETNPDVIDYCEQPIKMEIIEDNKVSSSIIDMWIKYRNEEEVFVEIKYTSDLLKDAVKKQLHVQEVWCEANQMKHLIKTENEIKLNPIQLSNLKLLITQATHSEELDHQMIAAIERTITDEPKSILQLTNESQIALPIFLNGICVLLYQGRISCSIDSTYIGKYMEVWK